MTPGGIRWTAMKRLIIARSQVRGLPAPPEAAGHKPAAGSWPRRPAEQNGSSVTRRDERIVTAAGQRVRQRPQPAGAAARRAERPTRVTGTIRPDPGSRWSPRSRQTPPGRPRLAGAGGEEGRAG